VFSVCDVNDNLKNCSALIVTLPVSMTCGDPTKPGPTKSGNSDRPIGLRLKSEVKDRIKDYGVVIGIRLGLKF